jgi:hypothetical protein
MLSAVRIPLISDDDRIVARLFRVQVNFKSVAPRLPVFHLPAALLYARSGSRPSPGLRAS